MSDDFEQHLGNLLARIFGDGGHRQAEFPTLAEAVAAADRRVVDLQTRARDNGSADVRRAALEAAVKAVCGRCRNAPGLSVKHPDGTRHHRYDGITHPCTANAIHNLLAAGPGEKS